MNSLNIAGLHSAELPANYLDPAFNRRPGRIEFGESFEKSDDSLNFIKKQRYLKNSNNGRR